MNYKIIIFVENSVYGKGLQGEYGFFLFVEVGEYKVLFDIGVLDLFFWNVCLLGFDLSDVEYVVLFYGYCDYIGGFYVFLKMNSVVKVVCKCEVFWKKFKNECENGMFYFEVLDKLCFWLVDEIMEIVLGVFVFLDVKVVDRNDIYFEYFFMEIEGEMCFDIFEDELVLVLKGEKFFLVLSVCLYWGIINIICVVQNVFLGLGFKLVMGGFYIYNVEEEKFNVILVFLGMKFFKCLGVCYCIGIDKYVLFCQ